ncbi:MAG TPA: hypothetical protein VEY91_01435 [Candidatus Limnocylindria bacterium]|nr:hypothetical protein [Candidatus Limnocylindria bacterium]
MLGLLAVPASAETLRGTVRLIEAGKPAADVGEALIWWEPEGGARRATPVEVQIDTRNRQFVPRTRAIPAGSTVRFPNADPIRHNVFSVSSSNRFDLGLYGTGRGKSQALKQPGLVRVFCNVHRQMAAWVMVLETPHHGAPDAEGRFALEGVPAGAGTLHVWHPRAATWTRALRDPGEEITVDLEATLPAVPQHLNKFGRPYSGTPSDASYR